LPHRNTIAIVEVENLSKSYGEVKAVNKVSFEVKQGEIFGFLDPNGAVKLQPFGYFWIEQRYIQSLKRLR